MKEEQLALELGNLYTYEAGKDERLLNKLEEDLVYCLENGFAHMQTAYLIISKIRYDRLYLFATNDDGDYIKTWGEYVDRSKYRFNISKSWILRNVRLYRIGISLGFTDEELLKLDTLSLSLASQLISIDRQNNLVIEKPEELNIEEGEDVEEINSKVRNFIRELDTLPPDQRVARVKGDILKEEKIYFELQPDFSIMWSSSVDREKKPLSDAAPSIIELFKKLIKDKSEFNPVLENIEDTIES